MTRCARFFRSRATSSRSHTYASVTSRTFPDRPVLESAEWAARMPPRALLHFDSWDGKSESDGHALAELVQSREIWRDIVTALGSRAMRSIRHTAHQAEGAGVHARHRESRKVSNEPWRWSMRGRTLAVSLPDAVAGARMGAAGRRIQARRLDRESSNRTGRSCGDRRAAGAFDACRRALRRDPRRAVAMMTGAQIARAGHATLARARPHGWRMVHRGMHKRAARGRSRDGGRATRG